MVTKSLDVHLKQSQTNKNAPNPTKIFECASKFLAETIEMDKEIATAIKEVNLKKIVEFAVSQVYEEKTMTFVSKKT